MNPTDPFSTRRPLIEPLEQRIAPALLINGANLLGGVGNPTIGEASIGGNSLTVVKVLSGEAIVWYDHGSIDAISIGPNTSLDITGNVGAIIGNLTATGQLSDSDHNASNGLDGGLLLPNNLVGLTTHPLSNELGSVGEIITGGSISNVNISGNLTGAYAGNAVFRPQSAVSGGGVVSVGTNLDLNPILPGIQSSFFFVPANGRFAQSGASISNVKIGAAEELQMFAGNGFAGSASTPGHPGVPGQAGGSISNITIKNAFIDVGLSAVTPSYDLLAGDGGSGAKGGAGGNIAAINEISSNGVVHITAGQGGVGAGGAGGSGGSIKGLNMQSNSSAYTVHAGKGGSGAPGGAGGSVTSVNFGGNALSNGIVVSAPFTGNAGANDILLIDSLTGTMVIEQNDGFGTGFTPVIQDSVTNLTTISTEGQTPVGAVAVDVNGDGLPDIVVAYKNSQNLGVFINQGKNNFNNGVFYTQDFTGGVYSGDTLDATSISLPFSPTQIAAGNFSGDSSQDLAVIVNNAGQSGLITLTGVGNGTFSAPTAPIPLPSNPVSLVAADSQGSSFYVGFQSGLIDSLIPTGASSGAAFTVVNSGISVPGGILNIDSNTQNGNVLALDAAGDIISIYAPGSTSGSLIATTTISLSQAPGVALVAHFVPEQQSIAEPIEVLTSVGSGSRLDVWSQQGANFVLSSSTASTEALKNFVPVIEGSTSGVAAVGGSVEHFAFSQSGAAFYDVSLPFSGKKVNLVAGDGGDGVNAATNIAAGGAGGSINTMNILAGDITVQAGAGGASINALAGAGGAVIDTPVLLTITGQSLPTILEADFVLTVTSGAGGSAAGAAHTAAGGAGGAVQALNLSLLSGDILVDSGSGGAGGGGAGGHGGAITAIKTIDFGGNLSVAAGNGGVAAGASGNGGAGGSILGFTHTLSLTDQLTESPFNVSLTGGIGGQSASAIGGAGGSVGNVNLTLQPSNESVTDANASPATNHIDTDTTLRVTVTAGAGGNGATGGAGGALKSIASTSVFDQIVVIVGATAQQTFSFAQVNPVTAQLTAGNGGNGSKGVGGLGGSVSALTLAGISHFDPDPSDPQAGNSPLVITSGNGGNGSTIGGSGGAIMGITSLNAQFGASSSSKEVLNHTELAGATIISGHGGNGGTGNGGAGGTITNLDVGVEGYDQFFVLTTTGNDVLSGGELNIQSGAGGTGGAAGKGGAGGGITGSIIGSAATFQDYGLLLQGGVGGSGALGGGTGGGVTNIQLNSPQNPVQGIPGDVLNNNFDGLSTLILAGNGGAATGATATGGTGGSISQIVESKDVNSSINLIQAGNGGAAVKTGGLGGSVSFVKTVGLIGQASDDAGNTFGAFQTAVNPAAFNALFPAGVPEGVFAGDGGAGAKAGLAGSVTNINAAQIAAIGAAANSSGLFAAASKVAGITAELIAYDVNGNNLYDNANGTNTLPPNVVVPVDGFIFSATAPTGINTSNNALLQAFEFVG